MENENEPEWYPHTDDLAVNFFAERMKEKLRKKRAEGRGGWDDPDVCSLQDLHRMLDEQFQKQPLDMVDIANFCMMIHNRMMMYTSPQPAGGVLTLPKISVGFLTYGTVYSVIK